MIKEYQDIESAITALLSTADGINKLESRRRAICRVAEVAKDIEKWGWADRTWGLCRRPGIWFSTTQGQAAQADTDGCVLSVQMLGREIGKLQINRKATARYVFIPLKKFKPNRDRWDWSRNPGHGQEIRKFLKALKENQKWDVKKVQEREIQWQLAEQLDNITTGPLKNLSTVRWVGCPTEIGVSLTAKGNIGTGTIDLLVRRRSGGKKGAQFLVFEVKRPGKAAKPKPTLIQAIRYAVALHVEANENEKTRRCYRTAFGSRKEANLLFGAVIVMENTPDNREAGEKALKQLNPHADPTHNAKADRLGMLLYTWNNETKRAHSWTWLKEGDPREKPADPVL